MSGNYPHKPVCVLLSHLLLADFSRQILDAVGGRRTWNQSKYVCVQPVVGCEEKE